MLTYGIENSNGWWYVGYTSRGWFRVVSGPFAQEDAQADCDRRNGVTPAVETQETPAGKSVQGFLVDIRRNEGLLTISTAPLGPHFEFGKEVILIERSAHASVTCDPFSPTKEEIVELLKRTQTCVLDRARARGKNREHWEALLSDLAIMLARLEDK